MKLAVKTLKGEKFEVIVEETYTISQVKGVIETIKSDLVASTLKLIHSGKILKDDDVISTCGIKENDFLVVMVTKPKKAAATAATSTTTPVVVPITTATTETTVGTTEAPTPTNATTTSTTDATVFETPLPASTASSSSDTASAPPNAPSRPSDTFPDEVVTNLTSMGFPEAEVRHCLRAAHGNPDIAVEFLTNGIPDGVLEASNVINASTSSTTTTPSAATTSSTTRPPPLQSLRNHPQFNALRQLVQSNPNALQQILTQIGQQQPELLTEINENQALFLQMMNEPISNTASSTSSSANSANRSTTSTSGGSANSNAAADMNSMMMDGLGGGNPAQMAQLIQSMSAEEIEQMAAMMGITADQLRDTAQLIGRMPPEQLNQFMMQAMAHGGGMEGMLGGGSGAGGQHVLRLTEEEMAAVDRLAEMGFDRSEAAQAFLACDKNEALAANLLMDSMANGGFFGGGDDSNDNNDGGGDDDDVDNMYD